jgi:hypothetical protein
VLDGRADAGAIGSPFWKAVRSERLVPDGALSEIWTSPPYNHCMFTARPDLDPSVAQRFAEALTRMSYDNPRHRERRGAAHALIAEQGCTGFACGPDRWQHHCPAASGRITSSVRPDLISGRDSYR